MANFTKFKKQSRFKGIIAGDSGAGKTGLIASLANSGREVFLLDADGGLDILSEYLNPTGLEHFHYIEVQDDVEARQSGYSKFVDILTNGWKDDEEDFGKIADWGNDRWLVVDTLDFLGKSALRQVLSEARKKTDDQPTLQDWGAAQRKIESKIVALCSRSYNCNLIVNSHLKSVTDEYDRTKFLPATVGTALSHDIGDYFNNVWRIDLKKSGRVIRTVGDHKMSLKCSAPSVLKDEEDFDLGKIMDKIGSKTETSAAA